MASFSSLAGRPPTAPANIHFPLHLLKSKSVPPAPNPSPFGSTIDWLPNFTGYSWIAYGASSLLVISHLPLPIFPQEASIGPILKQVFELGTGDVSGVSWSPTDPSEGDLAAAASNRIFLFKHGLTEGSFCWSQTASLVQSFKVEAIKWTGSGDGIVAVGVEVVLWKRGAKCWEIAWKFEMKQAQNLVSTTYSIQGFSASAPYAGRIQVQGSSSVNSERHSVNVHQLDGKTGCIVAELRHPQPVLMIQWRPLKVMHHLRGTSYSSRHVLATSCMDGTVRLWSDVDDGKSRRGTKETSNLKTKRASFFVVATVEISQTLNGNLGVDIFVNWAIELTGIARMGEKTQFFSAQGNHFDKVAHCEWLVAVGPGTLVTFWAVHCLDDVKPLRSPRLSLWKSERITGPSVRYPSDSYYLTTVERSHFSKVAILRNHLYAPPSYCSLVHLLPCHTLSFSLLSTGKLDHVEDGLLNKYEADKSPLIATRGILDMNGHSGAILQVAVHPCSYEAELAVSLDTNGLLIFWSFPLSSMTLSGLPTLNTSWNFLGKYFFPDISVKCTSLTWVPSWLNKYRILLSGHVQGIDCFIVEISEHKEEKILCHKLCTIPFPDGDLTDGPDKVYSVPIRSTSQSMSNFNHFLMIGIWNKCFQALSWTVRLHSSDFNECWCDCNIDNVNHAGSRRLIFKSDFAGKNYTICAKLCSQTFPNFDTQNEVTSSAVVCPSVLTLPMWHSQKLTSAFLANYDTYNIATGHADGTVRLWQSSLSESAISQILWDLVGMFSVNQGPVTAISVADAGQKIAIVSSSEHSDHAAELSLWEPVTIQDAGSYVLQDVILLAPQSAALDWFTVGNGQSVLGVHIGNEFHVYAQRRIHSSSTILNMLDMGGASIWFRIAVAYSSAPVSKFLWGSGATVIAIHEKHFSLYGPFSMIVKKKHLANSLFTEDGFIYVSGKGDTKLSSTVRNDAGFHTFKDLALEETGGNSVDDECNQISGDLFVEAAHFKLRSPASSSSFSMIEAIESWFGPLPFYHPEVLLMNIYTGKWKRAYTALKFLVEYLATCPGASLKISIGDPHSIIAQIKLSDYFEGVSISAGDNRCFGWSDNANLFPSSNLHGKFTPYQKDSVSALSGASTSGVAGPEFSVFTEALNRLEVLLDVTDADTIQTAAIVDLLKEICDSQSSSTYHSLDEPGRRYWCGLRVQQLDFFRRVGRMPTSAELNVNSRLMAWAFHSDCQENLLNAVLSAEPSWEEMHNLGIGFWFINATQLRTKMEKLARCQYLKNKDPKSCTLLYIALGRLQVLAGLFKISKDEKDKPLVGFLSRNFKEEKHKAAALKNAYVLMSRHQLQLAIAFFLLGGDTISAITVCAKNLGDAQLALVICRLVEGQSGPSECQLISKILLPSAIEKGDFWLASLLEWSLGNYCQSVLTMLGVEGDSGKSRSAYLFRHAARFDPSVGQYCQKLAVKTGLRNAIGEQNCSILFRWATVIYAAALNKCGLPLEALECLALPPSNPGVVDQNTDSNCEILPRILFPSPLKSCNWLLTEVAFCLENQVKSDLAMQYVSKLIREHPGCLSTGASSKAADAILMEQEMHRSDALLEGFKKKLNSTLFYFDQKFSVIPHLLLNKILVLSGNQGIMLVGYHILSTIDSQMSVATLSNSAHCQLSPYLLKELMHAISDMTHLLPRFVTTCSMFSLKSILYTNEDHSSTRSSGWSCDLCYVKGVTLSLCHVKSSLITLLGSNTQLMSPALDILDLSLYCVLVAFAKTQNDPRALILLGHPLVAPNSNVNQFNMASMREVLCQAPELIYQKLLVHNVCKDPEPTEMVHHGIKGESIIVSEDGKQIIGEACLWMHMLHFMEDQLKHVRHEVEAFGTSSSFIEHISSQPSSLSPLADIMSLPEHMQKVCIILADSLQNAVLHVSSYYARQLALFLSKEVFSGSSVDTQLLLEEWTKSQSSRCEQISMSSGRVDIKTPGGSLLPAKFFWNMCFEPKMIPQILDHIGFDLSQFSCWTPKRTWSNLQLGGTREIEPQADDPKDLCINGYGGNGSELSAEGQSFNGRSFLNFGKQEVARSSKLLSFKHPREICRRSGDLLEALCINSIDQQQAALSIDRKGLIFFNWNDGWPKPDKAENIWSRADWPQNCWAGTESVPIPTCVSPGVGLGRKKGSQLGLGGATVGVGVLSRKTNEITGGDAYGIPGYAGIGASGLGWEVQDDFEQLTDPPAGVGTVNARALSSHPSRDFFLVGSGNTHIYLWEFGKDIATATYGVLPAANVPPPYALASVTSLQFDSFGHRFANAASDGTVCSWQLDVGGRSNVIPTESSLCFNGYASDICYISTSGSIIAVSGYSSTGVNVVIWDTLAPPRTSQASVMCHEGGASSIAVFDNDFGTSSISPLIITGGKGGDVGLHDFRYIATGKMKKQRHPGTVNQMSDLPSEPRPRSNMGDQNRNGMLWYIPNAHSGSITRISTIPNTSLFLTGSKDGDVKLWDAKRANMVYRWPKLHEKHTFLQRSSSGFGSVSRVGVTDIRVVADGFLSCGGDGMVKLVQLENYASE